MKHFSSEVWDRYVRDELSNEERQACEMHLGSCDPCLELYMHSVERAAGNGSLPMLEDMTGWTEAVMERIIDEEMQASTAALLSKAAAKQESRWSTPSFVRHPVFHYTVAAVITLILMGTGTFQSLTERLSNLESASQSTEQRAARHPSVSHKIMEKTIVMLDSIQPKHDKGGDR